MLLRRRAAGKTKVKGKRLPVLCPAIRTRSLKDAQTKQRALPRRKGQG